MSTDHDCQFGREGARTLRLRWIVLFLAVASGNTTAAQPSAERTLAVIGGYWLSDTGFVRATRYLAGARLTEQRPARVDSVIDLHGAFVIPPFGEAHNHNLEASSRIASVVSRYMDDGVFYVENPGILPRNRVGLTGFVNVATGPDAIFANGLLTGAGGHPVELVARNVARGIWTPDDGEGAFYWTMDTPADVVRKWPRILAGRPDFIKAVLVHSEEYEKRRDDSTFVGWRGINPTLMPGIVRRAHASHLRVVAHVETAEDFRCAVAAGVDQIAHIPGFRGDEHYQLPDPRPYTLTDADARAAAARGVVVVTTMGGVAVIEPSGPDSARRRAFDTLDRKNLGTLRRASVHLAIGSDAYSDDSKGEARFLHGLGVFSDEELLRLWAESTPRAIFPRRRIGRVTPPAEASFIALACNPLLHFACTDSIVLRVKDGQLLK